MAAKAKTHAGSCSCGALSYTATGEPAVQLVCHCLNCQKSSGAGHNPIVVFPNDQVTVKGKTKSYDYTADSGGIATSIFCPNCGSQVMGTTTSVPGITAIRAGTLDDSSFFQPAIAVYDKRKRSWDKDHPGLPSFREMPPVPAKA